MVLINPVKDHQAFRELLEPGYCFSPASIRQFLATSRKYSDDNLDNSLPRTGDCKDYINTVLFPAWESRDSLLAYCERVAGDEFKAAGSDTTDLGGRITLPPVDPRMDPYGARTVETAPSKGEEIMQWIGAERKVESIVRSRTVNLLATKCGSYSTRPDMYFEAYERR